MRGCAGADAHPLEEVAAGYPHHLSGFIVVHFSRSSRFSLQGSTVPIVQYPTFNVVEP